MALRTKQAGTAKPAKTVTTVRKTAKAAEPAKAAKPAPKASRSAGSTTTPSRAAKPGKSPAAKRAQTTDRSPKTRPEATSVAGFLAAIADPQQRKDSEVVARMMRAATGCEAVMWGSSIVGFDRYHYRYDSGHEGDMALVGFSPRKQNLVLYVMPGFAGYDALMAKLGKHKTGKSCLYLKRLADVDLDVLDTLIRDSTAEMRRRYPR